MIVADIGRGLENEARLVKQYDDVYEVRSE